MLEGSSGPEFSPDNPVMEKERAEKLGSIKAEMFSMLETRSAGEKERHVDGVLDSIAEHVEKNGLEKWSEGVDWLENNNHRINLYQIAGQKSENWDFETISPVRAEQFRLIKLAEAGLKSLADSPEAVEAATVLARHVDVLKDRPYLCRTALDSLSRVGSVEADRKLEAVAGDETWPLPLRIRAVGAALRHGRTIDRGAVIAVLDRAASEADHEAAELAGLVGGEDAERVLCALHEKVQDLPPEKKIWWERDILSTHLGLSGGRSEIADSVLGDSKWTSPEGIVFGSIEGFDDLGQWVENHREKLSAMSAAIDRVNKAFGREPVRFVDISPQKIDGDGWTANGVYVGKRTVEHPSVSAADCAQSVAHEACERWESKGFVDAGMERDYLELMGDLYEGSELDKFRLNRRLSLPTRAGHPWDGMREFLAEAGSILLADQKAAARLFDPRTDKAATESLEHLRALLDK